MNATQLFSISALLLLMAISFIWVGRDAARRKRSSVLMVALCLLTWPLGFLFWRVVRPPALNG